ncbi:MAG: autotransporter outer membrane beta-barrel domain-containing protein [Phascolarctobacterium sp.]|uniref:autotransporter outer membrane beta-barrel domain-containing protein n=1 Tax=Phascolarctobacterium sp. TaxID=2049039 RepID=UPI0026DCF33B|nr:autotransporter outer membrane beta-barrel domain-containing protein [Phascolarctobacterium sp.]MDO4922334.1 autotransporter outer membrane beta-barrel domain-containing protein [Phascolarctobacterium sp.]
MKRKQILAKAITLGLLLAMPCSAWAANLDKDVTLDKNETYTGGLGVNSGVTLDGAEGSKYSVTVEGIVQSGSDEYGVINQGTIENIGTLTAKSILNNGKVEVQNLNINADTDSDGVVNSGSSADMAFKGGIINGSLINENKANLKINGDITIDGALWNVEDSVTEIGDGVTVTVSGGFANSISTSQYKGGVIKAGGAHLVISGNNVMFANTGSAEFASIKANGILSPSENTGTLIVNDELGISLNNSGKIIYNGEKSIKGSLQNNNGSIYVTNGLLEIEGGFTVQGQNAELKQSENGGLVSVIITGGLKLDDKLGGTPTLQVDDLMVGTTLNNTGIIEAHELTVNGKLTNNKNSSIYANKLTLGNVSNHINNSVINIHESIKLSTETTGLKNRGALLFDGATSTIDGKGSIINDVLTSSNWVGVIARNEQKDPIESLVINTKLVNQGELYATNLAVLNGIDGIEQTDGSFKESYAFDVDNLTILNDGEFALKNAEYDFTSVGVGAGAALTFANNLTVNEAMTVGEGASVTSEMAEENYWDKGSLSVNYLSNSGTLTVNNIYGVNSDSTAKSIYNAATGIINLNTEVHAESIVNEGSMEGRQIVGNDIVNSGTIKAGLKKEQLGGLEASTLTSYGGTVEAQILSSGTEELVINLVGNNPHQVTAQLSAVPTLTVNVNSLTKDQVVIDALDGGFEFNGLTVNGSSNVTDSIEVDDIEGGLQALADTTSFNKKDELARGQNRKLYSAAGKILGALYGETDANNHIITSSVKEAVNPANQGISEMASIALMTWRQENNDMNKRLGELRDSVGEHGVWVRMTRGEAKYGNQNIKNQYNAYQLGYDEKLSVDKHWTVGAALTYTDAESSFSYGKGENKHKGLAIYGSHLNDDGSFIDLIARYARLEHDYEVYGGAGKGDFDTNGYSLSAEYGKRFTQDNGLWIEPQVELTYGRVSSGEYLTNNGVRVRQEGMDSVVGRLGFALGKNLAQGKGNVYLRASYLYDFDGETDVRYSYGIQNKRFEQDLGGGWWEVGVGTNINLSEASHLYFDVEKTYGGDVATPWQWNAGVRWSF